MDEEVCLCVTHLLSLFLTLKFLPVAAAAAVANCHLPQCLRSYPKQLRV